MPPDAPASAGAPGPFSSLASQGPGREAVDLFVRSYQTLLRSTGEVRLAGLLEPYVAMAPSLHVRVRDPLPDAAALTYVGLRLPPCMPDVRLVLLGASLDNMAARGFRNVASWMPQTAPARRRRQFFNGEDQLAVLVSSPSDLDDLIPALVAYELEWNKLHELLGRDRALRRLVEGAAEHGPEVDDDQRLATALGLSASRARAAVDRLAGRHLALSGARGRRPQATGGAHAGRQLERLRARRRALVRISSPTSRRPT